MFAWIKAYHVADGVESVAVAVSLALLFAQRVLLAVVAIEPGLAVAVHLAATFVVTQTNLHSSRKVTFLVIPTNWQNEPIFILSNSTDHV